MIRRLLMSLAVLPLAALAQDQDARDLVEKAMDHWRGLTSYSEMTMIIHRPDWERSLSMRAWSEGDDTSLVRVTGPARDAGNGTLLDDNNMWTYSPKVNRIIKVPSSMMGQAWMGSDFSNKEISKSTEILDQYDHELTATETVDGHTVWTVTAIPHEDAAVVWGKEVVRIRDDWVLLEEQFWDQDGELVKTMVTLEIAEMGGRAVARRMRMGEVDTPNEWTEMQVDTVEFDIEIPSNTFTLSNLRNPRR